MVYNYFHFWNQALISISLAEAFCSLGYLQRPHHYGMERSTVPLVHREMFSFYLAGSYTKAPHAYSEVVVPQSRLQFSICLSPTHVPVGSLDQASLPSPELSCEVQHICPRTRTKTKWSQPGEKTWSDAPDRSGLYISPFPQTACFKWQAGAHSGHLCSLLWGHLHLPRNHILRTLGARGKHHKPGCAKVNLSPNWEDICRCAPPPPVF